METILVVAAVVVVWAVAVLFIIRFFMGAKRLREAEDAQSARAAERPAGIRVVRNPQPRVPGRHGTAVHLSSKYEFQIRGSRRAGTSTAGNNTAGNSTVSDDAGQMELEGQTSINELLIEAGEEPIHPIVVAGPTDAQIRAFLADDGGA